MFKHIVFAGTPEIASNLLKDLIANGYHITAVLTQPDRPKGRKQKLEPSAVKQIAIKYNLPVLEPTTLKDPIVIKHLQQLNPDLMIVFAYGLILPKEILNIPKFGCFNVHTSLLPKYRGAAPVQHTILNGEHTTGITIIKMDPNLDTGDIWHTIKCPVNVEETTASLYEKLQPLATTAILYLLKNFNNIKPKYQEHDLATYAHKIQKADAKIDWSLTAVEIERKIRAFIPTPVAFTEIKNYLSDQNEVLQIRIWQAKILLNIISDNVKLEACNINNTHNKSSNISGKILNINKYGIEVVTGEGILILEKLQFPGSKILKIGELINSPKYKLFLEKSGNFV